MVVDPSTTAVLLVSVPFNAIIFESCSSVNFCLMANLAIAAGVGVLSIVFYKWYKAQEDSIDFEKELESIADTFKRKEPLKEKPKIEFIGRIQYEPFNGYLTKTVRSFAFVSAEDGIYDMSQKRNDTDKCLFVGFDTNWIRNQCNKNRKFRLLLFPKYADNYQAIWCKWDNIFDLFKRKYYDQIYIRIKPFINDLKTKSFAEITKDIDFKFSDVEENGPSDPNYMSFDKFTSMPINEVSLVDVRLFLYCWLHFNELFDGDGYTQDENGDKGCKEYIIPNIKLDDINNLHIIPLDVNV